MASRNPTEGSRLEDRHQIGQAIHAWARAVDRRDWALVRAAFHPDAHDDHGMYSGGIDGLVEWLEVRHQSISRSLHFIGNIFIEFVDETHAVAESYVAAFQRYELPPDGDRTHLEAALGPRLAASVPVDVLMPARYVDEFEQRAGAWRIAKRTTVFEGRHVLSSGPTPALDPAWTVGRRDADDPLYVVRALAGLGGFVSAASDGEDTPNG